MSSNREPEASHAATVVNGIIDHGKNLKGKSKLCDICRNLDLSIERFIINGGSSTRKKNIRHSSLLESDQPRSPSFLLKSSSKKRSLGRLDDILRKSETCPFCYLIIRSVEDPQMDIVRNHSAVQGAICSLNWEVDGRQDASGHSNNSRSLTRRIHLSWDHTDLQDAYLVFVEPEKFLRPNSDAPYISRQDSLFLGRKVEAANSEDGEQGNQALIQSWLDLCQKHHGAPCRRSSERQDEFERMVSESYFGVIDVVTMQLKPLPVTLTEEYEKGIYYDERMRNIQKEMVDSDDIIRERVRARDNSGEQDQRNGRARKTSAGRPTHPPYAALSYVWGLQMEKKAYTTNLKNVMLHIQHGGVEKILPKLPRVNQDAIDLVRRLGLRYLWIDSLCIVQDSINSFRLNTRVMDMIYGNAAVTICAADGVDASAGLKAMYPQEHDSKRDIRECVPGVCLMVSRPPEMAIQRSKWNTRAWTFQERLLSPRCLIFTEGRVYFQCRSTGMSEDIFADQKGAGWSLDLVNAPLQMLREMESRALWVYVNCVSLYTSRELTKTKDILAAFTGMSNLIARKMQAPFIFGLPSCHFDFALLWGPKRAPKRRLPRTEDDKREYAGLEFPSWSWCGWMDSTMEYHPQMLDGCLTNVHEWLTTHTWIKWHVRDGHGNLRPLWDGKICTENSTTEERWRGYGSWGGGVRYVYDTVERILVEERPRYQRESSSERDKGESDSSSYGYPGSQRSRGRAASPRDVVIKKAIAKIEREDLGYPGMEDQERRYKEETKNNHIDAYGRIIRHTTGGNSTDEFRLITPENPYRVVMAKGYSEPDKEFPDLPILQFWTHHTFLHVVPPDSSSPAPGEWLCRCDIADHVGDWCGSIVLDKSWIQSAKTTRHEFIAISDAKSFTEEECDTWTYYIPKDRDKSEWDVYFVLLVEQKKMRWERVGLGKVFKAAFASSEWKEIILG